MKTHELIAQENFHRIKGEIEVINQRLSEFHSGNAKNLDSKTAQNFRETIIQLEIKASSYFKTYCYSRPRRHLMIN